MNDVKKVINCLKSDVGVLENYLKRLPHHLIEERCIERQLVEDMISAIKTLEKQSDDGWVSVNERLPKYDDTYYCTVRVKDGIKGIQAGVIIGMECVYVNKTWKNVWFQEISHIFDVIAWRELPELYEEIN